MHGKHNSGTSYPDMDFPLANFDKDVLDAQEASDHSVVDDTRAKLFLVGLRSDIILSLGSVHGKRDRFGFLINIF